MISFSLKNLKPLNLTWWPDTQKEWLPILQKSNQVSWRAEKDPTTGKAWAKLTPRYGVIKAKKFPGQLILRATGEMQDTAEFELSDSGFSVKTTSYGLYLQFGTSKMVARPWLGVPNIALKALPPISWKHILS
jgi:hypothetical protein